MPEYLEKLLTPAVLDNAESEYQDARQAGTIAFLARLLVQATLPHRRTEKTSYERRNGHLSLSVLAPESTGLPFGHYPRLLLAWITTEAIRTRAPVLELGNSLSEFMSKLGLLPTGGRWGTIARLRDHCQRLFASTIRWTYSGSGNWVAGGVTPVEHAQMFWDPKRPEQLCLGGDMKSFIRLSQTFFEEITTRPVPIDWRVLRRLAQLKSPLAIDIYCWLTYRVSYLQAPVTLQWEYLSLQFGGNYKDLRKFRLRFIKWLRVVRVVALWTDLDLEVDRQGLTLRPCLPHVLPMRLV